MFQEVPLYNEFVMCFCYFFIVILTTLQMYFRNDEEDKTGASMTHTMFDDQQVSTFVGQWNCFPGPDRCIQLIS